MRNLFSKTAFTAILGFAITFTLGCTGSLDPPGGANFSCQLSSGGCIQTVSVSDCSQADGSVVDFCQLQPGISSSVNVVLPSSNSSGGGGGSGSVSYQGKNYKTVKIGTQTWMAENLDYNVSGSKCYNDDPSNCAIYGRLYDWATAMALPSSCNSSSCASQVSAKHRGICPSGWHIPSNAEWQILVNLAGGDDVAGTKLKTTSGWNSYSGIPAGTDDYGFSALPGGLGYSDGYFGDVGYGGYWWSSSEGSSYSAYDGGMYYNSEAVFYGSNGKGLLFSVRCVQD